MKNKHATALGRIGGKVKSLAKTLAARKNAAKRKKKARIASLAVLLLMLSGLAASAQSWPFPRRTVAVQWGVSGDVSVAGDFDGDGRADLGIYRQASGEWFVRYAAGEFAGATGYAQWGLAGDVPMPADYDGDHIADVAVYRPSTGIWHIRFSSGQPL